MDRYLDAGYRDTFRVMHPDTTGAYSWWSFRRARGTSAGASFYVVADEPLPMVTLLDRSVGHGLDHCPVTAELDDGRFDARMAVGWSRSRSRRPPAAPWRWGGRRGGA